MEQEKLGHESLTFAAAQNSGSEPIDKLQQIDSCDPQSLAQILRRIGAVVLFASAIVFMTQSWSEMSSFWRYGSFLTFTVVLAALGFYCGGWLKESKGARTFLGIAAGVLPAHFAQLGALIYACSLGKAADVPELFKFESPGVGETAFLLGVALIILIPVAYSGVSALFRPLAKQVTIVYFISCAALLVPTRDAQYITILFVAVLIMIVLFSIRHLNSQTAIRTWEGGAVQAMIVSPALILFLRSFLYSPAALLLGMGCMAIGLGLFLWVAPLCKSKHGGTVIESIGVPWLGVGWTAIVYSLFFEQTNSFLYQNSLYDDLCLPLIVIPLGLMLVGLSSKAVQGGAGYRRFAAVLVGVLMLYHLIYSPGVISSFICIISMIVIVVGAYLMQNRNLLVFGAIGFGLSLLYHIGYTFELASQFPWIALALIGTVVILLATHLENKGLPLILKTSPPQE